MVFLSLFGFRVLWCARCGLDNMARHETRAGVCFPGTGIARRREPECRAPMFANKLKHRKENRHHEKLHTPPARACPEPNSQWSLTTLAYNLKRVLNLVSFEKLMQAVGVKVPQSA